MEPTRPQARRTMFIVSFVVAFLLAFIVVASLKSCNEQSAPGETLAPTDAQGPDGAPGVPQNPTE